MENRQRIYFPQNDRFVIVGLTNVGGYVAHVEGEPLVRGYGHSRLAAIADLNEAIEAVGSIYERDETPLAQAAE